MLTELIIAALLVAPFSLSATFSIRGDLRYWWQAVVIGIGPMLDAMITWFILDWLDVSFMALWTTIIAVGIISTLLIQPFFSSRRLLVFRLAMQQVRRKPRQAALMMAGLLVASAIITSSLVVGDSLDATVNDEVEAMWGDTDILVYSLDRRTGLSDDLSENLTLSFGETLQSNGLSDSYELGLETSATLARADGKADPSVSWFAYRGWEGVRINQVAADELEIGAGDIIEVSWYSISTEGKYVRNSDNLTIDEVIPNKGIGAWSGTRGPGLFTSLSQAQELQGKEWMVNRFRISMPDKIDASDSIPQIKESLDELISSSDASFETQVDGDVLSIAQTSGFGRLDSEFVTAWRENASELAAGGSTLEVLQVPLIQISQGYNILVLSDETIEEILPSAEGDWYVAAGSVSFQIDRGGDAHGWEVPDGGLINDVELVEGGLIVAHDNGLTKIPEDPDGELEHLTKGQEVLLASNPSISLPELPETLFDLEHEIAGGEEWLRVEGLFGSTFYAVEGSEWVDQQVAGDMLHSDDVIMYGDSSGWTTIDGSTSPANWTALSGGLLINETGTLHSFNSAGTTALATPNSDCDQRSFAWDGDLLCTTSVGVLVDSEGILTPRLPLTVDISDIGTLPQLVIATDSTFAPQDGGMLVSNQLTHLDMNETIWVTGLMPYAYGDDTPLIMDIEGSMSSINAPGLDELEGIIIGMVDLETGAELAAAEVDERSMIIVTGGNVTAINLWLDGFAGTDSMDLNFKAVKEESSEAAEESSGVLSAMFLVFGTFTIGAGILLVLTIVIMLADQRRQDEAIIRALGLKRSDMRALAMMEGVLTSAGAAILGGIVGLVLAWLISLAFSSIFATVGAEGLAFSFSLSSMLVGMSWGFIIAMSTLWATALWTSRLNIVEALRGLSPVRSKSMPWWMLFGLIILLGGGLLSGLTMLTLDSGSSLYIAMWHIAATQFIIALVPMLTWVLPNMLGRSMRNAGSNTMAAIGLALFAWALLPDFLDPIRAGVEPGNMELAFAVLGIVEVFAGVLVLSGLAPRIAGYIISRTFVTRLFGPVPKIALAHPASAPLRTAIVMGMFSLTVFSVIVLSGYSVQFESHSTGYVDDASGDFEILLASSRQAPMNLSSDPSDWNLSEASPSDIDAVGRVSRAVVWLEKGEERTGYILRGVDDGFVQHGGIPLSNWDHNALGPTEKEAWINLTLRPDLVFIDSSFALIDPNTGESINGITITIGESISLIDISNPGNSREVVVGGILSQSSNLFSAGIWMGGDIVEEQFGGVHTRIYVSTSPGVDASVLEESLSSDLAKDGVHSSVIEEEVLVILGLVFAILSIFQAYLALGLIVGIAGIGVVTFRSVSERAGEIGMLRALGWRRRSVMFSMLTEISWVSVLGMLNGAAVALAFHLALHGAIWEEQGVELILPWGTLISMLIGGWILVLLATIIPVRRAMSITPAQALASSD